MTKPTIGQSNWGQALNDHLDTLQAKTSLEADVSAKLGTGGALDTALNSSIAQVATPADRLKTLTDKWRARVDAMTNRNVGYGASIAAWTSAATTIVGGVNVDAILSPFGAYSINPAVAYFGAFPDRRGSNYPAQVCIKGWGLTSAATDLPYRVGFWHEGAAVFEVRAFAQGGVYNTKIRVWVDDVLISGAPADGPGSGGAEWRTRVALPDISKHKVVVELSGLNCWYSGLTIDPAAKVTRLLANGTRRIGLGDSQLEGQNGVANAIGNPLGYFPLICQAQGVLDYWQSGLGETGLLANGVAHDRANQVTRVPDDVVGRGPNEVWMFASQNDASQTKANLKTALNTNLDAIIAGNPTCQIRLIGNFLPRTGAGLTSIRDAYKEVAAARGMAFLDASTFITDANQSTYLVAPGTNDHLSPLGHREFAAWVLARIEAGYAEPGLPS